MPDLVAGTRKLEQGRDARVVKGQQQRRPRVERVLGDESVVPVEGPSGEHPKVGGHRRAA